MSRLWICLVSYVQLMYRSKICFTVFVQVFFFENIRCVFLFVLENNRMKKTVKKNTDEDVLDGLSKKRELQNKVLRKILKETVKSKENKTSINK